MPDVMDTRNREIYDLRHNDKKTWTLDTLGYKFGITRERVRQILWKEEKRIERERELAERRANSSVLTDIMETRLEEAKPELSNRTFNCLRKARVMTVKDIAGLSEAELFKIRNFGVKCFEETKAVLDAYGLSLRED